MIQRRRVHGMQNRRRRANTIAIEQDRHLLHARRKDRPSHRRNFPAADLAKDFKRAVD